ncbi:unnamed protein product, partial [Rotaria sp. Silwood1]
EGQISIKQGIIGTHASIEHV